MEKKTAPLYAALVLSLLFASCSKKEEDQAAVKKAAEDEIAGYSEGVTPPPRPAPLPSNQELDVPKSVKAKYHTVTMGVGNRKTKEIKQFKVKIGGKADVPGTAYTIEVRAYLPTWSLKGKTVTSRDDRPVDPAVRAVIYESGKPVFDGYIFQKHKTPSFMTDDYAIGLLGAS